MFYYVKLYVSVKKSFAAIGVLEFDKQSPVYYAAYRSCHLANENLCNHGKHRASAFVVDHVGNFLTSTQMLTRDMFAMIAEIYIR